MPNALLSCHSHQIIVNFTIITASPFPRDPNTLRVRDPSRPRRYYETNTNSNINADDLTDRFHLIAQPLP